MLLQFWGCQANIVTLRSSCKVAWGRARWKPYTSQECLASTDFAPVVPRPPQYTSADRRCRVIPRRFSQSDWPALAHPRQAHPYRCRHPTRRHRRIGGIDSLDPLVPALSPHDDCQEALTLEPNLLGWGDVPPSAPFARSTIIHSCHLPCWHQKSVTEPPGLASPQSLKLIVWLHPVALPLFRGLTLIGQIRRFALRVDTGAPRAPPRLSHPIILRLQGDPSLLVSKPASRRGRASRDFLKERRRTKSLRAARGFVSTLPGRLHLIPTTQEAHWRRDLHDERERGGFCGTCRREPGECSWNLKLLKTAKIRQKRRASDQD